MRLADHRRMAEFDLLGIAADGMGAQRAMLDVAARNVAAAQASSPDHPYPRLVARFASPATDEPFAATFDPDGETDAAAPLPIVTPSGDAADALTEMIAVLDAQRAYEANASVFDVGKRLAERTLDVGRS
jgi:flagellar basal body rod protein FlgC